MNRVERPHEFWVVVAEVVFGALVLLVVVAGLAMIISVLARLLA
jgi:hypothetical protein